MPRITASTATSQFRVNVDKKILGRFQSALDEAEKAGLRVDIQTDVEQLLRRLTKIINDAAAVEATTAKSSQLAEDAVQ